MRELILAALLANLSLLVSILLPGIAIRVRFGAASLEGRRTGDWAIEALACGSIWATLQFVLLYGAVRPMLDLGSGGLLAFKYALDLGVVLLGLSSRRPGVRGIARALVDLMRTLLQPVNAIGIALAIMIGSYAVFQFPYAIDNSALFWLAEAVGNPEIRLNPEQSPFYVAWIYWPTLIAWPMLAPSTIGAGAKIALHVAAFFALKRLCRISTVTSGPWVAPVLYVLSLFTLFGEFGLINSGKATLFAIVFLFAAMATLIQGARGANRDVVDWGFASLMALAIGFGATAIPYGLTFATLYYVLATPLPHASRLLLRTGAAAAVPTIFTMGTILDLPFRVIGSIYLLLLAVLFVARGRIDAALTTWDRWVEPRRRPFEWFTLFVLVSSVVLLLPLNYARCSRPPLDGSVGFVDMFLESRNNGAMPEQLGFVAFAGFLVVIFGRGGAATRRGVVSLICFPFAVLVPVLLIARADLELPFHPQKLWDLAKNVPNWCWGVLANYFALLFLIWAVAAVVDRFGTGRLGFNLPHRVRIAVPAVLVGALLVSEFFGPKLVGLSRWNVAPHLTSTGGHRMAELAFFSDAILHTLRLDERQATPSLYIDQSATKAGYYWELRGTGVRVVGKMTREGSLEADRSLGDEFVDELVKSCRVRPTFVVAGRSAVQGWWENSSPHLVLTELDGFEGGDSLYLVALPSAGGGPRLALASLRPLDHPNPDFAQAVRLSAHH